MRMIDRQGVEKHIVCAEAPIFDKRTRIRGEILLAEHGAFRAPGRAGCIKNGGEIVRTAYGIGEFQRRAFRLVSEGPLAVLVESFNMRDARLLRPVGELTPPRR